MMASKKPDPIKVVTKDGQLMIQLEETKTKTPTKRAASVSGEPQPSSSKNPKLLTGEEKLQKVDEAIDKAKSRMPDHKNKEMFEELDQEGNSYAKLNKGYGALLTVMKRAAEMRGEKFIPYRFMMKKIHLTATDHPELRSAVEEFLNKSKAIEAPIFEDILKIVEDKNVDSVYGTKQKVRDLAVSLFSEAAGIIKDRRQKEWYSSLSDFAEEENGNLDEDPITTDETLKAQLEENDKQNIDLGAVRPRLNEEEGNSEQEDVDQEDYDESKDDEYVDENKYDSDILADSDSDDYEDPTRDVVEEEEESECDEQDDDVVQNGVAVDTDVEQPEEGPEEGADASTNENGGNQNGAPAVGHDVVELDSSSGDSDSDCQIVSD